MKKLFILIAAIAASVMMLAGCSAPNNAASAETTAPEASAPDDNNISSVVIPITKCSSLEEINEAALVNLCAPAVMGVTDEAFVLINNGDFPIAEYTFSVNGTVYVLRGSGDVRSDISGYYIDAAPAFEAAPAEGIQFANGEGARLARWFTVDGQYVLSADDSLDEGIFASAADELQMLTTPAESE